MKWMYGVLAAVMGCGSTPNPLSCLDGTCTDPNFPFCDDGRFQGTPSTCISVECNPGEVVGCRDAEGIYVCNPAGNSYDVELCAHGCANERCNECRTNAQCSIPTEICDPIAKSCRGCEGGDECESGLCESGTCIPASQVVYASPSGDTTGSCTRQQPCTLDRATTVAVNAPTTPILKLSPGTYETILDVHTITPQPLRVLGEQGVVFASSSGLRVQEGAAVDIRLVEFLKDSLGPTSQVTCGNAPTTDPISTVKMTEVRFNYRAGGGAPITAIRCQLEMTNVDLGFSGASYALSLQADTTATLDRVWMHPIVGLSTAARPINITGQRTNLKITNSLFQETVFYFSTSDQAPPYSQHMIAFNTFVFDAASGGVHAIDCRAGVTDYNWNARVENNIIYAPADSSAIGGPHCATSRNVVLNIAGGAGTNLVADPQFVDAIASDYHLKATSPALNAAMPQTDLTTNHDFDGVMRPQGAAHDIGAFERLP
ncbi:MAG: choice-of-anchor Q domain-containing protein [Kofleriaceae bacterium]